MMYLKKLNIHQFRVLKDLEVSFQEPNGKTADPRTGNVINVIAGVNGCGKTSLLDAIYEGLSNPHDFAHQYNKGSFELSDLGLIDQSRWGKLWNEIVDWNKEYALLPDFHDKPRLMYLPSQQSFQYQAVSQLTIDYVFAQKINTAEILGRAEFFIKEYVLNLERQSSIADPKARTQSAVDQFNAHFLNAELLTQLVDLSKTKFNRPVFRNVTGDDVTIDLLSDGEKQLYARVIALMMLNPNNAIILIDEPEIALHPAWQEKIMQIYANIGTNNQFIVATHSPQIIASVAYQNRILLTKDSEQKKIVALHLNEPPSGIDVNSILIEIMGANTQLNALIDLQKQYRQQVDQQQENTPEAQKIKQKILNYENERSSFMQEMDLIIDLRNAL
jgi:predicted ATP-binding protein involved in virulence